MVSIVLVTYNRARRLKLSIQDILKQTFTDFELIICDDCSTDGTERLCREFALTDDRIRYFRHDSNMRMPANCNFGIQKAKYDYVAILHDGDRFKEDLIEQWYKAITSDESIGFVFNTIGETGEHEQIINVHNEFQEGIVKGAHLLKNIYFRRWRFDSPVWGEAMVRKNLVQEYGFMKEDYGFYADVDLWMHILQTHNAYYCADPLITGPSKTIQPQLFTYNQVKVFIFLYAMHLKQRRIAFKGQSITFLREMARFFMQSFFSLNYVLLLVVKNYSFRHFIEAGGLLKRSHLFLISWSAMFVLYPVLYPAMKMAILSRDTLSTIKKKTNRQPHADVATSGFDFWP